MRRFPQVRIVAESFMKIAKKLFENSKLVVFVIEDDQYDSLARINGLK